jgi:hypothetical protein
VIDFAILSYLRKCEARIREGAGRMMMPKSRKASRLPFWMGDRPIEVKGLAPQRHAGTDISLVGRAPFMKIAAGSAAPIRIRTRSGSNPPERLPQSINQPRKRSE